MAWRRPPPRSRPTTGQGQPQSERRRPPTRDGQAAGKRWGGNGPSGPSGDRSSRSAGDKRGPAGQGDGPKSSASSTNPRSPGLPGSLRPSLRAASKLQRLPKAAAEVSGQARAPKSPWSLGPASGARRASPVPAWRAGMPAPPPQLPRRNRPCLPVPVAGPGLSPTPANTSAGRTPAGQTQMPPAAGVSTVSRGPQRGLHPSQGTSRTSQACHTEQSVTRKASAWGPPASGSPPPRAQERAAVLLARGGTSETVPSPPWGLRGAVADA